MKLPGYRAEIDGLRGLAVLAVVLYHADPRLLPGGFVGVDVFFVISGYLITRLLAAEWAATGRIDFTAFYARRARRLLPALVLVVLVVMAASALLLGRHGQVLAETGESAVSALFFLSNFYFQQHAGGYFDGPSDAVVLLHLWSLSVEEQFYFFYPALLALLLRWVPGGVVRRLAVLSLASFLLAEYWVHLYPERAFYQVAARFWELAAGGMIALAPVPAAGVARDRGWAVGAGLALFAIASAVTPSWRVFPASGAVPAVLAAGLVLWAVHGQAGRGAGLVVLRSRPLVFLGLLSYSWYLWHWPLLAIDVNLRWDPASAWWRLGLCLAALALAWLTWRFVETPFRLRAPVRRATLVVGLGASALAAGAAFAMAQVDRVPADARRMAEAARVDFPGGLRDCHFDGRTTVERLPGPRCHSLPGQAPALALWGDSHAYAWQPFAWRLADARNVSAGSATMNSCLPDGGVPVKQGNEGTAACAAFNRLALAWLAGGEVKTVVVALRWPLGGTADGPPSPEITARGQGLEEGLRRLAGVPEILLMGPVPRLSRGAPECLALGWEDRCAMSRADFERTAGAAWRELEGIAARHPNVTLVDPTNFFCGPDTCLVSRGGHSLYWDNNHVSASAARAFAADYLGNPGRYRRGHGGDPRSDGSDRGAR